MSFDCNIAKQNRVVQPSQEPAQWNKVFLTSDEFNYLSHIIIQQNYAYTIITGYQRPLINPHSVCNKGNKVGEVTSREKTAWSMSGSCFQR